MKNHMTWMIVGILITLLLIFLLPALGVAVNISMLLLIALLAVCIVPMLLMMRPGSHKHRDMDHNQPFDNNKR